MALTVSKQALVLFVVFAGGTLLLVPQSAESVYVLLPALVAVWLCCYCIARVWRKDGEIPILDIGVLCIGFTTLYTVIPLLNFYFGGLSFGPLSDGRLQTYRPSAEEMGLFFGNYVAYLGALAFSYAFFRRSNRSLPRLQVTPPKPSTARVMIFAFVALSLYFAVLLYVLRIGFKSAYGPEDPTISPGSLWLEQINGRLSDIQFVFQAAVIAFLVLRKDDVRMRGCLYLVIGWSVVDAIVNPGSRGELMWVLLLTFLFWHKFHGTSVRFTFIFLPVVFVTFMFLGLFRSFLNLQDVGLALEGFQILASAGNEFQSALGTAFDVYKMIERGVDIPPILAFNDFTPMLPPQQFLPFAKLNGADWYLVQIGHDGIGVGFMWGVISQALIGFGLPELVLRGLLLGWLLARIHRWYQRRYTKFLATVIYTLLCLISLWTFRDTTGAILWAMWWQFIPFVLIFYFLGLGSEFSPARSKANPRAQRTKGRVAPA